MTSDLDEFLIRGHQKVIDHYRWLLACHRQIGKPEHDAIVERLAQAEAELSRLMHSLREAGRRRAADGPSRRQSSGTRSAGSAAYQTSSAP